MARDLVDGYVTFAALNHVGNGRLGLKFSRTHREIRGVEEVGDVALLGVLSPVFSPCPGPCRPCPCLSRSL